jgi:hypothetical protein
MAQEVPKFMILAKNPNFFEFGIAGQATRALEFYFKPA